MRERVMRAAGGAFGLVSSVLSIVVLAVGAVAAPIVGLAAVLVAPLRALLNRLGVRVGRRA